MTLTRLENVSGADCVIVAVGHNEYRSMSMLQLKELFKSELADEEKVAKKKSFKIVKKF